MAGAILAQAELVRMAMQRVMLENGCTKAQINFANSIFPGYSNANAPSDNSCNIFASNGGNITPQFPPSAALDSTQPNANTDPLFGSPLFENRWASGSAPLGGVDISIMDNVNCWNYSGQSYCSFLMVIPYVKLSTCLQINNLLSVSNPGGSPPAMYYGSQYSGTADRWIGTNTQGGQWTINLVTTTPVFSACISGGSGSEAGDYFFYATLWQ